MKLIKEHYQLSQKLNKENLKAYENIVVYLRSSSLTSIEAEEIIGDVLDMLLAAQERGETATTVFGEDLQAFCEELIRSNGKPNQVRKIKELTSIFINTFIILIVINYFFDQLYRITLGKKMVLTTIHFPVDSFLLTIIFTFLSILTIKKVGKSTFKRVPATLETILSLVLIVIFALITFVFTDISNIILFSLPLYLVLPFFLLLWYSSYRLSR